MWKPRKLIHFRNLSSSSLIIVVIGEVDVDHAVVTVVHHDVGAVVVQVLGERGDGGASGLALALVVKQFLLSFSSKAYKY